MSEYKELKGDYSYYHGYQYDTCDSSHISVRYQIEPNQYESRVCFC